MNRTSVEVEAFINDLDLEELGSLVDVIAKVDRLAMKDGQPVYTPVEIDLIGRFTDFNENVDGDEIEAEDDEGAVELESKTETDNSTGDLTGGTLAPPTAVTAETNAAATSIRS